MTFSRLAMFLLWQFLVCFVFADGMQIFDWRDGRFHQNNWRHGFYIDSRTWGQIRLMNHLQAEYLHRQVITRSSTVAQRPLEQESVHFIQDFNISSPNFPKPYPNLLNRLWNVTTAPGHRIKLVFKKKELENGKNCPFDRLSLYDGQELASPSLGVYCGHDEGVLPDPVLTSSNAMLVTFRSDISRSWMGFSLELSTVCGGILNVNARKKGLVSHPTFGNGSYGRNLNCDWIIKSRPERQVQLSFTSFDVGNATINTVNDISSEEVQVNGCPDSNNPDCIQYNVRQVNEETDFIEVFDGPNDYSELIGKYSGNQIPPSLTSRGEELLIRFRSGSLQGDFQGFRAVYQEL